MRRPEATRSTRSLAAMLLAAGLILPSCLLVRPAAALPAQSPTPAPDPYAWLEQVDSARSLAWVHAQDDRSLKILQADPLYKTFDEQALAIAQASDRIPLPDLLGESVTNLWQDATHVQGLWRRTSIAGFRAVAPDWQTLIDLDALGRAEHHRWVFKGVNCYQPQDRLCMVGLSDGGQDAVTSREYDLQRAAFVPSGFLIPRAKQDVAWEDPNTLLVATDWGPGSMTQSGYPFIVKRLQRGQPLAQASEIFRGTPTDVAVRLLALADAQGHRAIILERGLDFFRNAFLLVTKTGPVRLDLPEKSVIHGLLDNRLVVQLDQDFATKSGTVLKAGSLAALDLGTPGATLQPIFVPGPTQALDHVAVTAHHVLAAILDNVRGRALVFTPAGGTYHSRTLALPDNEAVSIASASGLSDAAYLLVTGFLQPNTLYFTDLGTEAAPLVVKSQPAKFDASRDVVEQLQAVSTDGTRIPYFVVHPREMKLDGKNPTLLTAYGGFQISETPVYNPTIGKLWLERGGVYVLANIRGGGEFGPAWHEAGLKTHRQRIYDDFAAVAKDLIARKITSPAHLGIRGRSNGGLLMGVEFEQHPDLWNAVIIGVPLLDMLRYEHIAAGASWVGEYGSNAVPAEHAFLEKISPYNNLRPGTRYPTPYIFTTTSDDRVGPAHARKFAALMAAQGHPFLYYESTEGGHIASANLKEAAREQALEMTYLSERLGGGA
jgi:prolyl oligopeptidase